jgi:hypothetical protein
MLRPRLGTTDILGDGRLTYAEAVRDLPVAEPPSPCETQPFFALTHGAPLCRPLRLPPWLRKAQDTAGYVSVAVGSKTLGGGSRLAVESVAAFAWNRRQRCHGISGNFRVESVAGLPWNRWQACSGISGSFGVEYAPSTSP